VTAPVVAGPSGVVTNAAATRFATVTALDQALIAQAKAEWYRLQLGSLQGSFIQTFLPAVQPGLVVAQTAAAQLGAAAVAETTGRALTVIPSGFAGYASSGQPLPSLLARPLIGLYVDLDHGLPPEQALQRGMDSMERILATQVQDAARQASQVQMVEHRVTYYIRHTEPGACSRCTILAGKHYKVSTGFLRHLSCRCWHSAEVATYLDPTDGSPGVLLGSEAVSPHGRFEEQSPKQIFDDLTRAEQDRLFTPAGAQAIRDGANIPRVVNARSSGMSTVTDRYGTVFKTTTVGARPGQTRLLPESIYTASNDPATVTRLLIKNGYITG
jgi:hypothetical protein